MTAGTGTRLPGPEGGRVGVMGSLGVQVQGATRALGTPGTESRVHGACCQAGGSVPW